MAIVYDFETCSRRIKINITKGSGRITYATYMKQLKSFERNGLLIKGNQRFFNVFYRYMIGCAVLREEPIFSKIKELNTLFKKLAEDLIKWCYDKAESDLVWKAKKSPGYIRYQKVLKSAKEHGVKLNKDHEYYGIFSSFCFAYSVLSQLAIGRLEELEEHVGQIWSNAQFFMKEGRTAK